MASSNVQRSVARGGGRGFILLVVLLVLAVSTVGVASQLGVLRSENIRATRQEEGIRARAAAEACVEKGNALLTLYMAQNPQPIDFDRILDPDGTPGNADDFVPNTTGWAAVTIIPSGTDKQRFGLLRDAAAKTGCLLRFEDNSDDATNNERVAPASATGNTPSGTAGAEGPVGNAGVDNPARDRDQSIMVVAIGLYPVFAGTVDADVYAKAHARVTLRRFYQTLGSPAILAGGSANLRGNVDICGNGGVRADSVSWGSGACACGTIVAGSGSSAPGGSCAGNPDCGTSTQCEAEDTQITGSAQTNPPQPTVSFPSWKAMSAVGIGDTNDPVGCKVWARSLSSVGAVFVWEHTDDACAAQASPADTFPEPCSWTFDGTTRTGAVGSCGTDESPCWRLAARLDGTVDPWEQTYLDGGIENFRPDDAKLAVLKATHFQDPTEFDALVTSVNWNSFCTKSVDTTAVSALGSPEFRFTASGDWELDDITRADYPEKLFIYFDDDVELKTNIGVNTAAGVMKWALLSRDDIDGDGASNVYLCNPTDACDALAPAVCDGTDANVKQFLGVAATYDMPPEPLPPTMPKPVIWAAGGFALRNNGALYGGITAGSVDIRNNVCVLGNVAAHDRSQWFGGSCDASTGGLCTNSTVGICVKNNGFVVGNIDAYQSSVCFNDNATVTGRIWAGNDVLFENNADIFGQLIAVDNIRLDNNGTVVFSGAGGVGGGARSMAWVESSW